MKKLILIISFIAFNTSCEKKKNDCLIEYSNNISYEGDGIIKFNSSRSGSIRYIEFYPICNIDIKKFDIYKFPNEYLTNGIVIRENSSSDLWSQLINYETIIFDKDKYGVALIYLNFKKKVDIRKEKEVFTNYLKINKIGFKVRMIDIGLYNINVKEINIIRSL